MSKIQQSRFLDFQLASEIAEAHGTPLYVYEGAALDASAAAVLNFPNAFGLTARYAMKASPNRAILKRFREAGLHIDASSGYEVKRALAAGFEPQQISLSSQELPDNFAELCGQGVLLNACSLSQLERYGAAFEGGEIGIRFNPGAGSGGNNRTNVGGPASSFGFWHEWKD